MKGIIKKLLVNKTITVRSASLKGLRLKINHLIKGSIFLHDYEPDKQQAIHLLIHETGVFFDVGANIGLHSYFVATHYPLVKIFSFEPLPENINYIKETIKENAITSVQIVEAAVGSKPGESFFDISNSNFKGMLSQHATSLKVNVTTLDEFTSNAHVYPDVIKIDVEGAESEVLQGAENLISIHKPIFIIELHNPQQDVLVADFLIQKGYALYRINPDAGKAGEKVFLEILQPKVGWPEPQGVWGNIACIHNSKLKNYAVS